MDSYVVLNCTETERDDLVLQVPEKWGVTAGDCVNILVVFSEFHYDLIDWLEERGYTIIANEI